jgi:hypothetical protein
VRTLAECTRQSRPATASSLSRQTA